MSVAWIGLLVLIFNIAGGGLLPTRPAGAVPPFAQGLSDGRIVICTATGMVVMDRDGTIITTPTDQPGNPDLCVFCLPMLQGTAIETAPPVLLLRAVPPVPLPQPQVVAPTLRSAGLNLTTAPRGPPQA